jgi:hypothetical protein
MAAPGPVFSNGFEEARTNGVSFDMFERNWLGGD